MKTAVILAARKEQDCEIPYPLLPFDKEDTLLGRSIGILRELGICKILIVVGYQAELFKVFEANDVQIVVNHNYEFTSSMGSLAMVKDLIDEDFLLIEGDTFYEKKVLKQLSELTRELLGLSRISISTFRQLIQAWEDSDNSTLNYEYLLMDVTDALDRPVLMIKNLIWGEVDNMKDFKRLKNDTYPRLRRKENPYDKENLLSHLANIFPNQNTKTAKIYQIGGMSNKNFRVDFKGHSYVLRVPGFGSEGMVERNYEEFNSIEGSKLGLNPKVRYFNAATGIKLVDFILDAETLNSATIQRHDNMKKIANIYSTLHHSHVRLMNEFNIFREIEKYDRLLKKAGAIMYEGWEEIRKNVMSLESKLNDLGVDLHPCHNDAVAENFLKSKDGTIYLIDWEYSGMNDPMADFAALFLENEFTEENQDYILGHYFDGNVTANARQKILHYQVLWDYLWAQWTVIKEARGDDFGSYGFDRYSRAIKTLRKIQ